MLLYHPDSVEPIDCHPSKVEEMIAKGWTPEDPKGKPKSKPKKEVSDDG